MELDDLASSWDVEYVVGVRWPIPFTLMFFILQSCCDWYGPLCWRCYVFYLQLTWPYWHYFMQYDEHGLIGTTWINVAIYVVYYVNQYIFYLHVKSYVCSSTYVALSDHVRLWLWHYEYSIRVKSWLFLLEFASLYGVS